MKIEYVLRQCLLTCWLVNMLSESTLCSELLCSSLQSNTSIRTRALQQAMTEHCDLNFSTVFKSKLKSQHQSSVFLNNTKSKFIIFVAGFALIQQNICHKSSDVKKWNMIFSILKQASISPGSTSLLGRYCCWVPVSLSTLKLSPDYKAGCRI